MSTVYIITLSINNGLIKEIFIIIIHKFIYLIAKDIMFMWIDANTNMETMQSQLIILHHHHSITSKLTNDTTNHHHHPHIEIYNEISTAQVVKVVLFFNFKNFSSNMSHSTTSAKRAVDKINNIEIKGI